MDGRLFDIHEDREEPRPLTSETLNAGQELVKSTLQQVLEAVGFESLTIKDPYFPNGFDRDGLDYKAGPRGEGAAEEMQRSIPYADGLRSETDLDGSRIVTGQSHSDLSSVGDIGVL